MCLKKILINHTINMTNTFNAFFFLNSLKEKMKISSDTQIKYNVFTLIFNTETFLNFFLKYKFYFPINYIRLQHT